MGNTASFLRVVSQHVAIGGIRVRTVEPDGSDINNGGQLAITRSSNIFSLSGIG